MDFEYGADTARSYIANTLYNEDSVLRYRTESIEDILNDSRILSRMIIHHYNYQVPRLNILESYYLANNAAILNGKRRNDEKKADYRVRHAFADVISNFLNSYVLANPVKIDADQDKFIEIVENFNNLYISPSLQPSWGFSMKFNHDFSLYHHVSAVECLFIDILFYRHLLY